MSSLPAPASAEDHREHYAKLCSYSGPPAKNVPWHDLAFSARDGSSLTLRLYGKNSSGYPSPLLLWFHGGGYVAGSLDTHHAALTQLASRANGRIAHLAYRTGPEHRFPTALNDAEDALRFCRESSELAGPKTQIVVGGDGAGGNLAAALALRSPSEIAGQVLLYPTLDATFAGKSWRENSDDYIGSAAETAALNLLYATDEKEFSDPAFSPLLAPDLSSAPRAFLFLTELDPALSDGQAYVEKLRAAGVQVRVKIYPEVPHGLLTMGGSVPASRELLGDLAAVLG
jgi:acetyl esterase